MAFKLLAGGGSIAGKPNTKIIKGVEPSCLLKFMPMAFYAYLAMSNGSEISEI